jgi:hypothetical protein
MKSKGNSLYEVLKSASRPAGADEAVVPNPESVTLQAPEAGQPTLQERLAAYKAAKLATATQPSTQPEPAAPLPRVTASTLVLDPEPTPPPSPVADRRLDPAPVVSEPEAESVSGFAPANKGLGERVVKLTYNNVLFGGMITVGLLFISYAIGLHVGKGNAIAELSADARPVTPVAAAVPATPPPAVAAIQPRKEYAIRLGEWRLVSSEERVKAYALANDPDLKKALDRSGHKSFEKAFITRGKEPRMALYVDRFTDINSDAAKAALTAMKTFKFAKQTPFSQAVFEEVETR